MASTSNTYLFGVNTQLDDLFREAFERIGILGNDITPLQVQSAIMSGNLELSSWPGKGLNLWLVRREMFDVFPLQPIYQLPVNTVRVLEVSATTPLRLLNGTAASNAGGAPENCFNPNTAVGCTQNAPNGNISYDYGLNQAHSVMYVGVAPLQAATYTLSIDYSFDNVNWVEAYLTPQQAYVGGRTTWFVVQNALNARAWRIRETNGGTLAIQQIYFSQANNAGQGDRLMNALSRSEYMSIATKQTTSYPSGYYFDQTIKPTMILWPVPPPATISSATNILYTNYQYAQDITQMHQNAQIPQRFYDALVAGLSSRLAMKFMPDRYMLMRQIADDAYRNAANTDFENVTIRFDPDLSAYSG